jgi:hypothetical protein
MTLRERDAGWLTHRSDERPEALLEHPAVVLRVVAERFVVIHGTTTPRSRSGKALADADVPEAPDAAVFWVEAASEDGRALGLTRRTYFARNGVEVIRKAADVRVVGVCPAGLFLELRRIAGITG